MNKTANKKRICKVPDCGEDHYAKGYCKKHYWQVSNHGKILTEKITRVCKIPGCGDKHMAKGYCRKHYRQIQRHGKILPEEKECLVCKVPGCEKKHYAKGYCSSHYQQMARHGKIIIIESGMTKNKTGNRKRKKKKNNLSCKVPGCVTKHYAKGYCKKHYQQILTHGKTIPEKIPLGCKVPGCTRKHKAKGYCGRHYSQFLTHGKVLPEKEKYTICKVPGCGKKHLAKGYCLKHYWQVKNFGKILPEKEPRGCKIPGCTRKHGGKGYCGKHYKQLLRGGILPEKVSQGCREPGCTNKLYRKGYCKKHYTMYCPRTPTRVIKDGKTAKVELKDRNGDFNGYAIIDSENIEKVRTHIWFLNGGNAATNINGKLVTLKRFVTGHTGKAPVLCRNKNLLDNRKSNLLVGSQQQIAINAKLSSLNTSGHKGVFWCKNRNRWLAFLTFSAIRYYGGIHEKKENAVKARRRLEKKYHDQLKFKVEGER